MTDTEAIDEVRCGRRVKGDYSIHDSITGCACADFAHKWRTLFCNDVEDVVECATCGRQEVCACDFDEDFA